MQDRALPEGSKLEIVDEARDGTKHTYYSTIANIIDEATFDMQAPIEKGMIVPFEIGKEYDCYFTTLYGLFRCKTILEKRHKEGHLSLLRMKIVTQIVKYQRRGFFRLDVIFDFRYFNPTTEVWKEGTTLDISGNGMRCIIGENLPSGKKILCELNLNIDNKMFTLTNMAEVIDTIPVADNKHETRWVFTDIPVNKQDIIIKYIYDEQRRRRKKEGG